MSLDHAQLRSELAKYLGSEEFPQFVRGLRASRLRYWQEQEWGRFLASHPEFDRSIDDLRSALRICESHGDELLQDSVPSTRDHLDYAPDYTEVRARHFPNAWLDPVMVGPKQSGGDRVLVWYCPACRREAVKWEIRKSRKVVDASMLTGRTTLDEYTTLQGAIKPAELSARAREHLAQRRRDLDEAMLPGDELWEWARGKNFNAFGGLAVVRDGVVVAAWTDWRS